MILGERALVTGTPGKPYLTECVVRVRSTGSVA